MTKPYYPKPDQALGHIPFEVRNGIHRVNCTVSQEALEAVGNLSVPSTSALRQKSFARFRTLIHSAAKMRLALLPANSTSLIALSTEDLRRVPPEKGVPRFGSFQSRVSVATLA